MKRLQLTIASIFLSLTMMFAQQIPKPALVGYWENWGTMRLTDVHENLSKFHEHVQKCANLL